MNNQPQTGSKKKSRRFYLVLVATVLLLAVVISIVYLDYIGRMSYGPGPIEIEVTSDKLFYLQGEEIQFSIYINNQQDWPVLYPSTVTYQVEKDNQYIDGDHVEKTYGYPQPAFPAHSKTLYETYQWDQKTGTGSNRTLVQPGNYTFTVSFFHGSVDYGNVGSYNFEIQ